MTLKLADLRLTLLMWARAGDNMLSKQNTDKKHC